MQTKVNQKVWSGGTVCDLCGRQIKGVLYDAKTWRGPWATMDQRCWEVHSTLKLGTGHGQRYEQFQAADPFVKTRG